MSQPVVLRSLHVASLAAAAAILAASGLSAQRAGGAAAPSGPPTTASITDPRVGLRPGMNDAGVAAKNMELVSHREKADTFNGPGGARGLTYANSDLAFRGNFVYQGNFDGFQIWDISNVTHPVLRHTFVCSTGQGDPSIYGNLLFISSEGTGDRKDCSNLGVRDRVSMDRSIGVRIFDVSDPDNPKKVADVQTCRGSHTHTVVPDPKDKGIIYIYVSGSGNVRPVEEMAGCVDGPIDSANSARFRIEIIKVPLAHPEQAAVMGAARIFNGLVAPTSHGGSPADTAGGRGARGAGAGRGGAAGPGRGGAPAADPNAPRPGPNQCHDITVYPAVGLAGGACGGYGLLLDIKDPTNPKRIDFAGDSNFAYWHSATFNNEGTKVVFTDEWGGGTAPRCRILDPINWGADAIFSIKDGKLIQGAFFKMPAAQTEQENCVAHNGGLVPVPGRDIMVQGWYQGGVDVFEFTDPNHPREIAYFDRGPIPDHPERQDSSSIRLVTGGFWGAYYYNGHIIGSEIARGLDIFDLTASEWLTQNEIDAAKLIKFDQLNPQNQPKLVWPGAFPVVRSYLDQLVRGNGLARARTLAIAGEINAAEKLSGAARGAALEKLAAQVDKDIVGAADGNRVKWLASALRDLAKVSK